MPSTNFYIALVGAMGLGSGVYLLIAQPTVAPIGLAFIVPFVGSILALLLKGKETDTKVEKVDQKLDENTAKTQEAVDGVDVVHSVVNHQRDVMTAELAELRTASVGMVKEIAQLRAAITVERAGLSSDDVAEASPTPVTDAVKAADAAKPPTR